MANQVAIRTLTRPGDEVLVAARGPHPLARDRRGGGHGGVQLTEIGAGGGRFTPDDVLAARKPRGHMLQPPTTVIDVENTHNRAGGVV